MGYVIYKLCCDDCDEFYVGSTKNFRERKRVHKGDCNNPKSNGYNSKKSQVIRANGGWEAWRMAVIEECDETIKTKRQAEIREEQIRLELRATMNSNRAYRTEEQRKQYDKDYHKDYYQNKKESITKYKKDYYENKKETILEYKKDYREANKGYINEKFECECGGKFTRTNKARHEKSKKHQDWLKTCKECHKN